MRPVSAEFLRAVTSSHRMTARARLVEPGLTGTDPAGTETPILGGDVQLSASGDVRSTFDLETLGEWPEDETSPYAPYGREVFLERGIEYGNGITEWVSLGYHRIETLEGAIPAGTLRLSGSDRMAGIIEARLPAPRQFAAATTCGAVVSELVTEVYPAAVIEWDDATDAEPIGRGAVADRERFEFLADVVASRGKVWFWDHRGVLVIRDAPAAAVPVSSANTGPGGVVVELARQLSRRGAYNAVVVTGEAPDTAAPVRAIATDDDPASPTYYAGPFGPVPKFYSSSLITTQAQADKAAAEMLARELGVPYSLDFSAVPNPALEPLDPLDVDGATHVLTDITIGLTSADPLVAATREKRGVQ